MFQAMIVPWLCQVNLSLADQDPDSLHCVALQGEKSTAAER